MSEDRTVLHAKVREARDAQKALESQINKEARAAADAVRASYREQLSALHRTTGDAERALRDHINATASHEWEGKKVFRMADKSSRWASKPCMVPVYGVVEVRRSDTAFPAGQRHGLPELGQAFVRLLKADGTPGLKLDSWHWRVTDGWQLAEEVVA